ncbi:hypothetical protein B0675_24445 [Streptomyces sp. M41(2017)]|nr:hypothetical protein B0675_24445 [Streptomyces sp. M41(2017)]
MSGAAACGCPYTDFSLVEIRPDRTDRPVRGCGRTAHFQRHAGEIESGFLRVVEGTWLGTGGCGDSLTAVSPLRKGPTVAEETRESESTDTRAGKTSDQPLPRKAKRPVRKGDPAPDGGEGSSPSGSSSREGMGPALPRKAKGPVNYAKGPAPDSHGGGSNSPNGAQSS